MDRKLNVLHLLSWFPTPSDPYAGNFCLKQIQSVSDEVNSVVLSCCLEDEQESARRVEVVEYPNFKHLYVHVKRSKFGWWNKFLLFSAYHFGLRYVRCHFFNPDLIHQHVTLPLGRMAYLWSRWHELPYVLTEHWTIYQPQNRAMMTPRMLRQIRAIANHAKRIMPVSANLQHCMQEYDITAPFRVIPNVVDTNLFVPGNGGYEDGKKHILHVSTLREEAKNASGMLRVIAQLAQRRRDFVLDIVHDYPRPDLEQFVKENQLEDVVFFHGRKSEAEIAELYAHADFFLLFSNFENLPCVLIEAFACGLPVVTTDVGGIREIVDESRGCLLPAGDEQRLLEDVELMLDHHQEYDREAIRQYAEDHFSKPVIGKQIAAVYYAVFQ